MGFDINVTTDSDHALYARTACAGCPKEAALLD